MRVSKKSPDKLLRCALDIIASGIGYPSLFNDEVFITGLNAVGVSLEDAREYAPTGCGEMNIPGRNACNCAVSQLNTLMILTLALNNGRDPSTGEMLGVETGEFEDFRSFDNILTAYKKQFAYFMKIVKERSDAILEDLQLNGYFNFYSTAVTRDCLERGKKYAGGGERYTFAEVSMHGMPNVIDSLLMLKKYLFGKPEDRMTPGQFKAVLAAEFAGSEALRVRIANDSARWGNDDDEADAIARDLFDFSFKEILQYKNFFGGPFLPMAISFVCNQAYGPTTPATPDGRVRGEPLAAVNSSVHGCDRTGATALFNSMANIDWSLAPGSVQCGISLHPSMVRTDADRDKFIALLKTQIARKGFSQILLNVLDNETLRDAQKNPDKYRNINVRVSGYNAQFVDLPESVQNEIIGRTKHVN
jgi:formate C-acetyltransferase